MYRYGRHREQLLTDDARAMRLARRPFFDREGTRWTYRWMGLGKPVTVTRDEVIEGISRLKRAMSRLRWATGAILLPVYLLPVLVGFERARALGVEPDNLPLVIPAILSAVETGGRAIIARYLFARFERRPKFGEARTLGWWSRRAAGPVAALFGPRGRRFTVAVIASVALVAILNWWVGLALALLIGAPLAALLLAYYFTILEEPLPLQSDEDEVDLELHEASSSQ